MARQKIANGISRNMRNRCSANNALDFDDLLLKTVQLFQTQPDVLAYYQERFRYIMVDEYQDTNTVQFQSDQHLSIKIPESCAWWETTISPSINSAVPTSVIFWISSRYFRMQRSSNWSRITVLSGNILDAANAVIRNNRGQEGQNALDPEMPTGEKIEFRPV